MTLRMLAREKSLTLLRLSLFGILTLVASPVNAQETIEAGDMLITGVFGTQSFGLEGEEGDEGEDDGGAELEAATTFGGGFRYALTSRWGLEGNIQFSPTSASFEVDDIDEEGDDDDSGDDDSDDSDDNGGDDRSVNASYYTAGVTFNLLRGRTFIPFVTAGGGGVMLDISGGGSETKLVGMFGAGVLFRLTDRFFLRADVRDYVYSGSSLRAASSEMLTVQNGSEGAVNDLSWTGGATWKF